MLLIQFEATLDVRASLSTCEMAYPTDFSERVRPSAVTTTESMLVASSRMVTSSVVREPGTNSCTS